MKKKFFLWFGTLFFCLISLGLMPLFYKTELVIKGDGNWASNEIYEISGLKLDTYMSLFNCFESKTKLIKTGLIKIVKLKYFFPNQIRILVFEHKPVCYVKYLNNVYLLLDNNARILEVTKSRDKNFPVVIGLDFDSFCLGKKLNTKNQYVLDCAMQLSNVILNNQLPLDSLAINFKNQRDIHLCINSVDVLLGSISDCGYKIALLKSILDSKSEYLDKPGILNLKDVDQAPILKFMT